MSEVPTKGQPAGEQLSVCVVIPMYNAAKTIVGALESLSQQSLHPHHVVVVDDGSQDEGAALVEAYAAPYRLSLIRQQNQGPAAARNAGIMASSEDLVCFLDADDLWLPRKLELQLGCFMALRAEGRQVGIVDCFEVIHYANGKKQSASQIKCGSHFHDFIRNNIINGTSCVMAWREAIMAVGGFDTEIRFAEDRWLWTQIAHDYEVHTVPEVLSNRFIGTTNITANPAKYYSHKLRFMEKYLARFGSELSRSQANLFVFQNLLEFLRAFSRLGEYRQVVDAFERMYRHSPAALGFDRGKPLLRYLHARLMLLLPRRLQEAKP